MDIRVAGISKDFGASPALRDVSLEIKAGELVALLGPSGSGKTTLLRVIAGLERPASGHVYFGATDATRLSVQERQVGFVFQHYALFKHMTVAENVGYGLRVRPRDRRPSRAAIRQRVAELLDLVQLGGLGGRYPAQLSGGQRQRVALARALAVEPRVLLLDEPFGALDAKVRKDLRRWLRELHGRTGHTTIFVTHDQDEALELADRVAILNNGRLEQIGTPDQVYDAPASAFVMSFVGDTTSLPAIVDGGRVRLGGLSLDVDVAASKDGPAQLYLRPADVVLTPGDCGGGLAGTVAGIRRTVAGRRAELTLDATGTRVEIEVPPQQALSVGDRAAVHIVRGTLFEDRA
ncbi:sulfate/molybdate ABC transporter ATP-binding protein [Chelatococcus reniformis]|uniref:Sulfate/thiosulfate import ATP-binding protein CysA n=1 Tax=Chelatococcus reniformis TaxID=1494448 RepID=A0A916U7U5_9HYPH|nr:sulfate/molybdate ABC transporter ATP-binding protein [Chelatococcus reniformis]GGC63032.1 sulfate/thiosulfate import ATP-binding protein CysA [Chelatococcus reniformis]